MKIPVDPALGCLIIKNCTNNSSCPSSTVCVGGTCAPVCTSNRDCLSGQICLDGVCQSQCLQNFNCLPFQVCEKGVCRSAEKCKTNSDCDTDQVCQLKPSGQQECQALCNGVICNPHEKCVATQHEAACQCKFLSDISVFWNRS